MKQVGDIKGMFLPVPTPFDAQGAVDEATFASMLEFYVASGVNALFVLGSFGQGATLDTAQRMSTLEIALEVVSGRIPVVPDVGTVDPYRSRELASHARAKGVPAIAMVAPYYYTDRSPIEVIKHFEMVEEATDLPLFIYNNPAYQGFTIPASLMASIRDAVPQLVGMVHGGDSMASILTYQAALGPDFRIFTSAVNLFPGMLVGIAGALHPPLAFAPEVGVALVSAIERGDFDEALRLQVAIMRFVQQVGVLGTWFRPAQHEALRHLGFPVLKFPRWPTAEMPEGARKQMRDAIDLVRSTVLGSPAR